MDFLGDLLGGGIIGGGLGSIGSVGDLLNIPKFGDMLRNTFRMILEQFWVLLDKGYTSSLEIIEFIFGTTFPKEVKQRSNFTLSIISIVALAFIVKSSYSLFVFTSGVS